MIAGLILLLITLPLIASLSLNFNSHITRASSAVVNENVLGTDEALAQTISFGDLTSPFSKTSQGQLPQKMHAFSSFKATYGGNTYIYVLGGQGNGSLYNTVYRSKIDPTTGNLSAFTKNGLTQLPKETETHALALAKIGTKNYIYMLGGDGDRTVYKAQINSSTGDIGAWTKTGQALLPIGLDTHMTAVSKAGSNTYVYVIGGIGEFGNDVRKDVFRAKIDPTTGNMGAFSKANQGQLPKPVYWGRSLQHEVNGKTVVYVIAGSDYSENYNTVYKAEINPTTGNMGAWTLEGQGRIPAKLYAVQAHLVNINGSKFMYILGGDNGVTQGIGYKAPIDSNGNVGTFSILQNGNITTDEGGLYSHNINDNLFLYLLRGSDNNNTDEVLKTSINTSVNSPSFIEIVASGDSYIDQTLPTKNYGLIKTFRSDLSPNYISFVKFNLAPLQGKNITSAILTLKVNADINSGSPLTKGLNINKVNDNSWNQLSINFNNKPTAGELIETINGQRDPGSTIQIDLTDYAIQQAGQSMTISITNLGSDDIVFDSSESTSGKPTLQVTY